MLNKIEEVELTSSRLLLRPYQEQDAELFYRLIRENQERLAPAFPGRIKFTTSLDEARRLILQFKSDWSLGQVYAFGVWRKDNEAYIGDISLKNFDHTIPKAEVGYYLDYRAEGQGFGTEMLQTFVMFAMEQLRLNKLFIRSSLQNNRSFVLAERCGFRREGLIRQDFRNDQRQLIDIYYYGLTRQDYNENIKTTDK
jgi:RimJ/RimL family protein N-acetyltransferase